MATIRKLRDSDMERILEITEESFEGVSIEHELEKLWGPIGGRHWQWRKKQDILANLKTDPAGVFVAETTGRVIGFVTTQSNQQTGIGRIHNMAVDARHRNRGVGKKLLNQAIDHLKRAGMEYARIETLDQNLVGQRFYPRIGFKEVARQIHYAMPLY